MSTGLAKIAVAAGVAFGALALGESGASAMPALDQAVVGTAATGQGIEKAYCTVGTTGTIGTAGIVGTAVGDQHGLSSAARLCSRAFFQAGSYAQQRMRRHRREAANPTKTLHVKQFCPIEAENLTSAHPSGGLDRVGSRG